MMTYVDLRLNMRGVKDLQNLSFIRNSNLKIGILGGSFNPAHIGHIAISMQALHYYKFDLIIWLVANQNPFKINSGDILLRARNAQLFATHPKIIVSTAEYDLGLYQTYDVLHRLMQIFPHNNFTWLMGIDNLVHFHKWHRYREILTLCNIIIFDRPCNTRLVNLNAHKVQHNTLMLDKKHIHNIIIHRGNLHDISSSQIRKGCIS